MLIEKYLKKKILCGIWKIDENIDELYKTLKNETETIDNHLLNVNNKDKLREKLAVRVLLQTLTQEKCTIAYHETGKPYLADQSLNISISHTDGYAAVALSENQFIGIDIEKKSDKVKRVKNKFINENELIDPNAEITHLLIHWSAKESIYKAYNKKGIDFRNDIQIEPFLPQEEGIIKGSVKDLLQTHTFEVEYSIKKDYVYTLAYAKN